MKEEQGTTNIKMYDLTSNAQRVFDLGIKRAQSNFVSKFEDYKTSYMNVLNFLREKKKDRILFTALKNQFGPKITGINIYDTLANLPKAQNTAKENYVQMQDLYRTVWSLTRTAKWSETFDIGDLVHFSIFTVNALMKLHKMNASELSVQEQLRDTYKTFLTEEEAKKEDLPNKTSTFMRMLTKIKAMPKKKFQDILQTAWVDLVDLIKSKNLDGRVLKIINKNFGSHYSNLDMISKLELKDSSIEPNVNENFSQWWSTVKSEGFPIASFYPALQVWLEIDKLFKSTDIDALKMTVYASIWVLLVSGKYILANKKKEAERMATEQVVRPKRRFSEDLDPGNLLRKNWY